MANYYTIKNNQKSGPFTEQQLQKLAELGRIGPDTPIVTETGDAMIVKQIPGLFATVPPPFAQPPHDSPSSEVMQAHAQQATETFFSWIFDFAFQDIRIHTVILWFCRIFYALSVIATICSGLWATFMLFVALSYSNALILLGIPIVWLGVVLSIFLARLYFELIIIVLDWIVETTKAARLYIENNKKE